MPSEFIWTYLVASDSKRIYLMTSDFIRTYLMASDVDNLDLLVLHLLSILLLDATHVLN